MIILDESNSFNPIDFFNEVINKLEEITFDTIIDEFMAEVEKSKKKFVLTDNLFNNVFKKYAISLLNKEKLDNVEYYYTTYSYIEGSLEYSKKIYYSYSKKDFTTVMKYNDTVLISDMSINLTFSSSKSGLGKQVFLYFFDLIKEDDLRDFYLKSVKRKTKNKLVKVAKLGTNFNRKQVVEGEVPIKMLMPDTISENRIIVDDEDDILFFKDDIKNNIFPVNNYLLFDVGMRHNIDFSNVINIECDGKWRINDVYDNLYKYADLNPYEVLKKLYDQEYNDNIPIIVTFNFMDLKEFKVDMTEILTDRTDIASFIRKYSKYFIDEINDGWVKETLNYIMSSIGNGYRYYSDIYKIIRVLQPKSDEYSIDNISQFSYLYHKSEGLTSFYIDLNQYDMINFDINLFKENIIKFINNSKSSIYEDLETRVSNLISTFSKFDLDRVDYIFDNLHIYEK